MEAEEIPLSSLNAECKRLKNMRKLKESFTNEVGATSWEEATSKYPSFATEQNLERYLSSSKLSGPVLAAFQQFCRRAVTSQVPLTPRNNSQSVLQILTQTMEGKEYHSVHNNNYNDFHVGGTAIKSLSCHQSWCWCRWLCDMCWDVTSRHRYVFRFVEETRVWCGTSVLEANFRKQQQRN